MFAQKILRSLKNFRHDTRGVVSVEMVLILPLLFWSFAAVATFFDAYRTRSLAEKAAFTISDMLSRETNAVTAESRSGRFSFALLKFEPCQSQKL